MEASSIKKMSSQRPIEAVPIKRIKRLYHIKSLPAHTPDSLRKPSISKIQLHTRDEHQNKPRRFKTQQHLKPPHFGAVKTARERNAEWAKKKDQSSLPSKSLTKSTTYRSPQIDREQRRQTRLSKQKRKKSLKKMYSGILRRVKEVVEEYQLKLDRCFQQKQEILRENNRLKNQIELMGRKTKRFEK